MKRVIFFALSVLIFQLFSVGFSCLSLENPKEPIDEVKKSQLEKFLDANTEHSFSNELQKEIDTLEDQDIQACSTKKEICNALDDNCNGLIDDNIPPKSCIPKGVKRVCSKGTFLCSRGKAAICSYAILPLSPSCLSIEDLDCDNKPDSSEFGRRTKQSSILSISFDFKILSQITLEQTTYIVVARPENSAMLIELWTLDKDQKNPIVLFKEDGWHSELRTHTLQGKMFATQEGKILVGFCLAPNETKRCLLFLADIIKKDVQTLSFPKSILVQSYGDFFYRNGTLAILHFDPKSIRPSSLKNNVTSTLRLYKLQEKNASLKLTDNPSMTLKLSKSTLRLNSPLKDFRFLKNGDILLISFINFITPQKEWMQLLTTHLLSNRIWNHYIHSTNKVSFLSGKSLLLDGHLTFPYHFSNSNIPLLKMKWNLSQISFDLKTNKWKEKTSFAQVEGIIRINGLLKKDGGSLFAVSQTTCDNVPDSLFVYTFDKNGTETGKYLFSTQANPKNLYLQNLKKHFIIMWLSGNELLCGLKNEKTGLHWFEFGNCRP